MRRLLDVDEVVALLDDGVVVALPTDTVYGVAASLRHPDAISRLFALKRRPSSSPLPVLVDSLKQVTRLGVAWPEEARRLSEAFWPGALTIVVRVPRELARRVGSTSDSAGFRVPDDVVLRRVLERSGPLAVSSANEHGEPPCVTAAQVLDALGDRDELGGLLDDGERGSRVSSVVDLSEGHWRLLREGSLSRAVLRGVLG